MEGQQMQTKLPQYTRFYIRDDSNGERFYIATQRVKREDFLRRRKTECVHRPDYFKRHCTDCSIELTEQPTAERHECNEACFRHLMGLVRDLKMNEAKAYVDYIDDLGRLATMLEKRTLAAQTPATGFEDVESVMVPRS